MRTLRTIFVFVSLLHAAAASAQSTGSISGRVITAAGAPAPGIRVLIVDLHRVMTTDSDGRYSFDAVPFGRHVLQAESLRFGNAAAEVRVAGATTADLELDLAVHSEEIVVTASPDARAASEVAQAVDAISGEELQVRQQPTLGETLAQQPGVTSTGFVPGASRPVIRGFGGDRIRVLEDGVGTGDASSVSQDHNVSVDPVNAESIEIVRGPATLLYGSNAVGGVVNVIDDRIPLTVPDRTIGGIVDLRATTNANERNGHVSLRGGAGSFAWHGSYNDRSTDDYDTPEGRLFNSDIDAMSGSIGGSFIASRGMIGLSFTNYDTNYGISEAGPGVEPDEIVRIDMEQKRWDLKGEAGDLGPFSRIRVRFGTADYEHSEVVGGEPEVTFLNDFNEGRIEASHRDIGMLHGAIGVQFSDRDFRTVGEEFLLPPTKTTNNAIFVFEEVGRSAWRLQFGGRYERQKVNVTSDEAPDRTFSGLSGSASVVWVPNADYTAALAVSRSSRLPVAEELYFNGPHEATFQFEIGNPDLTEEKGNGLDLSFRKRTGFVTGSLSAFYQRFDGFIFQNPTGDVEDDLPVFEFAQQDATFRGAEAHVDFELFHTDPHHLALELSGDVVRAKLKDGGDLPFIPPSRIGVGLRYQGAALSAMAEVRRVQGQNRVADFESPTDGYTLVNASVGYRFFFAQTVHDLLLRGTNLTDEIARNHVNPLKEVVPIAGRDVTLSYRLTF